MGKETEKKFLLTDDFETPGVGRHIRQGYLNRAKERTVRVRTVDDEAFLTVKGPPVRGTNPEFEFPIPPAKANELLEDLCERPLIEKTRYEIDHAGFTWEVDVFHGENEGLAFAEIELKEPDQPFDKPPWIGEEVTGDPRYFNSRLSETPFREWNESYAVTLYFDPAARALGERIARGMEKAEFGIRADNWNDASEPGDGPLERFAPVNTIHFHPGAAAKAVQVRDRWAQGFALKEGNVVAPGSTWAIGPRQILLLVVTQDTGT
jgi:CYTH domain-containing protein